MSPHGRFKAVGPTRPASAAHRPQLPEVGLDWAWPCLNTGIELVLSGFASILGLHLVKLSLILRSDIFCDILSGQSVLVTCILAQKHILHICKGEVWFRDLFR